MLKSVHLFDSNHDQSTVLCEADDITLINRVSKGDKAAMTELISRYYYRILDFSLRYMGDKMGAEDMVQEAFSKVWQKARSWQDRSVPVSSWLYRIVANVCIDELRKRKSMVKLSQQIEFESAQSPENELSMLQNEKSLNIALSTLPPRQRTAIVLCAYQGFTNIDAARIMDVSIDALESLLSRGRRQLRKLLIES